MMATGRRQALRFGTLPVPDFGTFGCLLFVPQQCGAFIRLLVDVLFDNRIGLLEDDWVILRREPDGGLHREW